MQLAQACVCLGLSGAVQRMVVACKRDCMRSLYVGTPLWICHADSAWCPAELFVAAWFHPDSPRVMKKKKKKSADLCTPWKNFQYSEGKNPYCAQTFRTSLFLVAPPTVANGCNCAANYLTVMTTGGAIKWQNIRKLYYSMNIDNYL